jgi:hypothetical protein
MQLIKVSSLTVEERAEIFAFWTMPLLQTVLKVHSGSDDKTVPPWTCWRCLMSSSSITPSLFKVWNCSVFFLFLHWDCCKDLNAFYILWIGPLLTKIWE